MLYYVGDNTLGECFGYDLWLNTQTFFDSSTRKFTQHQYEKALGARDYFYYVCGWLQNPAIPFEDWLELGEAATEAELFLQKFKNPRFFSAWVKREHPEAKTLMANLS